MYLPVNLENLGNMNWSIVVIGAIIVLPGIYWVTNARHVYIKEANSTLESAPTVVDGISQLPSNASVELKH
jgi:choline transport protein